MEARRISLFIKVHLLVHFFLTQEVNLLRAGGGCSAEAKNDEDRVLPSRILVNRGDR